MSNQISAPEISSLTARDKILNAAFDLFHERGVKSVTVDDILKQSSTGKSQFYHYFKSKEGLIHAMLQGICQSIKDGEVPLDNNFKSWDDFDSFFDQLEVMMSENDYERGCPICTIASSLGPDDELLRQDIMMIKEAWKTPFRDFFVVEKACGRLIESANPDEMASFMVTAIEGASMQVKIERSTKTLRATCDHILRYMKSFICE